MPGNPLAAHPPWRQLLIVWTVMPVAITLVVLAFAWPAARLAPRDLPVGVVGTGVASQRAAAGLTASEPGAFDVHLYGDEAAARTAIQHRDVYGAFVITPARFTALTATAASPTVAQLLTTIAQHMAAKSAAAAAPRSQPIPVSTVDVVPTTSTDPHGAVLSSSLLPLVFGGEILAVVIAVLVGFKPAWRQFLALSIGSALAGLGAYAIAQGFLGALPGQHVATWAALALTLFAISCTTAGLFALLGAAGIGLAAALMIFVGNPFSGVTSAPELLPHPVGQLGQWLPPGAGGSLLRSTAYFNGNGAGGHVAVLAVWSLLGLGAIVVGHRRARRRARVAVDALQTRPADAGTAMPGHVPSSHARPAGEPAANR
jgi:hypothetical protein